MEPVICVLDESLRDRITSTTSGVILFNSTTFEPYFQCPAPYEHIRITTGRSSDVSEQVAIMNDIVVARTLVGPAFPYLPINAERWVINAQRAAKKFIDTFTESETKPTFDVQPAWAIRDMSTVNEGGSFIGEIPMWSEGEGTFGTGISLKASHHNRGIASAVLNHIFSSYIIPHTSVQRLRVQFFYNNIASRKLWENLGFQIIEETPRKQITVEDAKGGGVEDEATAIWTRPE